MLFPGPERRLAAAAKGGGEESFSLWETFFTGRPFSDETKAPRLAARSFPVSRLQEETKNGSQNGWVRTTRHLHIIEHPYVTRYFVIPLLGAAPEERRTKGRRRRCAITRDYPGGCPGDPGQPRRDVEQVVSIFRFWTTLRNMCISV